MTFFEVSDITRPIQAGSEYPLSVTPRRVLGLVAMAATSWLALQPRGAVAQDVAGVVSVSVVGSVSQLAAAPPIRIGDGRVRLGLERSVVEAGRPFLAYCLVEGIDPDDVAQFASPDALGPVWIATVQSNVATSRRRGSSRFGSASTWSSDAPVVFVKSLAFDAPGDVEIRFLYKKKVLARANIRVLDGAYQGWAPLHAFTEANSDLYGLCLPSWPNVDPIASLDAVEGVPSVATSESLPLASADRPSDDLKISLEGTELAIRAQCPLRMETGHFLVRWWVNGRPVQPPRLKKFFPGGTGTLTQKRVREVRFKVVYPTSVRLDSGDRVAVQLLYCPEGSKWAGAPFEHEADFLVGRTALEGTLLSNRADTTVR
ncbi:MAG TPA: hypothetical protein VFF73_21805 [Planctomycetota bacterium]|nr:hypothetical protein [Planctomycetota bacterium]